MFVAQGDTRLPFMLFVMVWMLTAVAHGTRPVVHMVNIQDKTRMDSKHIHGDRKSNSSAPPPPAVVSRAPPHSEPKKHVIAEDELECKVRNISQLELSEWIQEEIQTTDNEQLLKLLKQWVPICSAPEYNGVLPRHGREKSVLPYTMAVEALRYAEDMRRDSTDHARQCGRTSSFLQSVTLGHRGCSLRLLPPLHICQVLDQYSHIVWLGDSLTRHTLQALLMLLSEDLQQGAMPVKGRFWSYKDNCHCK
jgi:hypothetical protein